MAIKTYIHLTVDSEVQHTVFATQRKGIIDFLRDGDIPLIPAEILNFPVKALLLSTTENYIKLNSVRTYPDFYHPLHS